MNHPVLTLAPETTALHAPNPLPSDKLFVDYVLSTLRVKRLSAYNSQQVQVMGWRNRLPRIIRMMAAKTLEVVTSRIDLIVIRVRTRVRIVEGILMVSGGAPTCLVISKTSLGIPTV